MFFCVCQALNDFCIRINYKHTRDVNCVCTSINITPMYSVCVYNAFRTIRLKVTSCCCCWTILWILLSLFMHKYHGPQHWISRSFRPLIIWSQSSPFNVTFHEYFLMQLLLRQTRGCKDDFLPLLRWLMLLTCKQQTSTAWYIKFLMG